MAESRSHGRGLRIAPPPPSADRRGARLPPLAAPRGLRAGGRSTVVLIYLFVPAQKMDAIKITRGRTRRSQGAGDALGGPSSATAGGRRGRAGGAAWPLLPSLPPPPAAGAVQGGGRRGAPARRRPARSATSGRKSCRGECRTRGEERYTGKGEGESGPGGLQGRHSIVPSKARRRGLQFRLRSGEQRPEGREGGSARQASGSPGLEQDRCSAGRDQPNTAAAPPALHNILLACPSANARREICPSLCLDRFLQPRRAGM